MEKEVEAVLELFRKGLVEGDECKSMKLMFEGIRRVSAVLPFPHGDSLTSHPELLKMLLVCSPMNRDAVEMLLEALLNKFQDREYVVFSMWKLCEGIAQLDNRTAASLLNRKIIDFDEPANRKPVGVLKTEEQYMSRHLWEIKQTVLAVLPQLLDIIHKQAPSDIKEKLSIFRLLKADCRNPELVLKISRASQQLRDKYKIAQPRREPSCKSKTVSAALINTRRQTVRKLPPQNNFAVDRLLIEELVSKHCSEDLLSLLKTDINVEAFLSYIVHPSAQPIEERFWGVSAAQARALRASKALEMLRELKFFRRLVAAFPQIFNVFFCYLESKNLPELNFIGIKQLLELFLKDDAPVVTSHLFRSELLEEFYPYLEDKLVYEFLLRAISLSNISQISSLNLKKVYHSYLQLSEFFPLLISNMYRINHDGLIPIPGKDLQEFDQAVKRFYADRRRTKTLMSSTYAAMHFTQEKRISRKNRTTLLARFSKAEKDHPEISHPTNDKGSKQSMSDRVSIDQKPTYGIAKYQGYYSTAPVMNFFCVQQENVDVSNEQWHYTNCCFYLQLIQSIVSCPFEMPPEIVRASLPNNQQLLQGLFLALKKYTALLPQHPQNSAKKIIQVLNLLLECKLFEAHHDYFTKLSSSHIGTLYPIICRLFQQGKEPVQFSGAVVVKTIGEDAIQAVRLLANFIRIMRPSDKTNVLDSIQEDLWFILMLWFFDCTLNNIYQSYFYDIMAELFQHASQSLLVKILFKYNMVSCLHNAYSDVVRQRILVVDLNMQSFYLYIRKMHSLIETSLEQRADLRTLQQNICKTVSWYQLSNKIRLGLYTPRENDDYNNSVFVSSNTLADSPRNAGRSPQNITNRSFVVPL